MKRIALFLIFCVYSFNCQSNIKLTGTPISLESDKQNAQNAFDGKLDTEFRSFSESGGWVGLEFSSPVKISQIGWAQKSDEPKDYLLGIFEGANDASFCDSIPLYMITSQGQLNQINLVEISCTQAFKYIRYIGPNGKFSVISQIEIYGEQSSDEYQNPENFYQPTNLPLVIINTENGFLPPDKDKESQVKSNIVIIKDGKIDTKRSGTIKYRGNSTLNQKKNHLELNLI